jgi:hypothetical protein
LIVSDHVVELTLNQEVTHEVPSCAMSVAPMPTLESSSVEGVVCVPLELNRTSQTLEALWLLNTVLLTEMPHSPVGLTPIAGDLRSVEEPVDAMLTESGALPSTPMRCKWTMADGAVLTMA